MHYEVVSKIHINKERCRKIGEFLYDPEIDGLYFEGKYPFPVQLMISAGLSKCQVTPMFLRLPFILRGWINLDVLMLEIDLLKLALQDQLLLHGSCVNNTLIVGFSQAGKTYQTYRLVANGGTLISEEYTVIKRDPAHLGRFKAVSYEATARSCLSKNTIKACNISLTLKEKIELALKTIRAKLMPFMFEAVIWKEIRVSGRSAVIERILYGSTGALVKNYKHLIILTENEYSFMSNDFLGAYALMAGIDLIDIQRKQRQLIKDFVQSVYPVDKKGIKP